MVDRVPSVKRITLSWATDRSFTPVAQLVAPSHLASSKTRASSNPTSNISFQLNACACVSLSYHEHVSLDPQGLHQSWVGTVGTYNRIRSPVNRYVPKMSPFQGRPRWLGRLSSWLLKSISWVQFSPSAHIYVRTRRDFSCVKND